MEQETQDEQEDRALQEKRERNRKEMPNVTAIIDAHVAAFGDDFKLLRCVEYETRRRIQLKGVKPYPFLDENNTKEQPN